MFKKLLCKHKFEYYHKGKYIPLLYYTQWTKWHFICKGCGKTKTIYESILKEEWKHIVKKVAKEEAMGMNHSDYENEEFILGCYTYRGKGAYYMKEKYKNLYQEKSIPYYS